MEITEFLKDYSQQAALLQDKLFQEFEDKASQSSAINKEMVKVLRKFACFGKHIRGALTVLGYQCAGGAKNKDILQAAIVVDLLHSALLIADDVMDQDDLRRGNPTIHKFYENRLAQKYKRFDPYHFGVSMAFNLSLLAIFFAEEVFSKIDFGPKKVQKAQEFMNSYLALTVFGQGIDVVRQGNLSTTTKEILTIHRLKTAYYTISGPLQVGGILGGASKGQLRAMAQYGEKVGVAFQLRDDELGIFGDEQALGKPVNSDLKEGKNTVLFVKAFELANANQFKVLKDSFGNSRVNRAQLKKAQEVIVDTGALQFSQDMKRQLITQGKLYVPQITLNEKLRKILYNIADFMVKRKR